MPSREQEPLLHRPSSERSSVRGLDEEDALITGQTRPEDNSNGGWKRWREIGLFAWALIATAAVIVLAVVYQKQQQDPSNDNPTPSGKRNLIFMVSDGMGPTSLSLTRSFNQYQYGLPWDSQLVIDKHLIGQSRTRSTSSLVTDSAAGATAFSCGKKSYNGAISVVDGHDPCGTVLEAAKKAGYMTGLVVTTRITDATPACFAAHVNTRSEEDRIAEQMVGDYPLGRVVDLMLGGGRCHFLANTTAGSCRADDKDVIALAKDKGFQYISTRKEFDGLDLGNSAKLPLIGLFAPTDIPFELDRRNENDIYPSLDEMARTAINALSKATANNDKGFFLLIEGSRIDHAGHTNDPAAQVHEVLAYDKAMASVLKFLEDDDTEGVMVSTSDHETGGLVTSRQLHTYEYPEYLWYPAVLANSSKSAERLASEYHRELASSSTSSLRKWLAKAISKDLGIKDAADAEIQELLDRPQFAQWIFADMISRRAQIGWTTHGHSAADVNIYASNPQAAAPLVGNHENTDVGKFLRNYLGVDVEEITKELKQKGTSFDTVNAQGETVSWMGKIPERLDEHDHYHG